jgi:division protein 1
MEQPSLIKGFKATIPSSELPKQRRRLIRGGLGEEELGGKLGLKKLGDRARGLLTEGCEDGDPRDQQELEMGRKSTRRKARERRRVQDAHGGRGKLCLEDLVKQADEISQDKENLHTRTVSVIGDYALEVSI